MVCRPVVPHPAAGFLLDLTPAQRLKKNRWLRGAYTPSFSYIGRIETTTNDTYLSTPPEWRLPTYHDAISVVDHLTESLCDNLDASSRFLEPDGLKT
jgi:hypothetical protein